MQFYESGRLIFLWLIPAVFLLGAWGQKDWQKKLARLGEPGFIQRRLMPGFSESARRLSLGFMLLVFFFSALALARPQWGEEKRRVERKGVDLVFLLDTSLSMLAEDVKPSRLGKAKLEIKNILRRLKGDRVGMVAFAGSSFLQCPLTLDYGAFLLFVDALKPGYIPDPGTSLSNAIRLGIRAFPEESKKYRALIIFSDGEDHEGGIDQAIEEAKKAGVRIYAVGTGTVQGDPIPLRSAENKQVSGYKKDQQGEVVITRLNPELLTKVAQETGGLYLPATASEREIDLILKHLETLGERKLKERLITEREDHFQVMIFIAFLLLAGESLLGKRKRRTEALVLPLLAFILFSGFINTPHSLVQKGNKEAEEKKYQSAVEDYRKAQVARPDEPIIRYNLGTALYQLYEYQGAEKELEQSLAQAKDPETKARILYNYGNTQYRLGDFEKAIQSYKKVLEINPKDEDAKYNLEFLQKKKSLFEKKEEERQKEQKQNPQQNQQKQPQQQQKNQQQQSQSQSGQQGEQQKNQSQSQQDQNSQGSQGQPKDQKQQDQQQQKDQGQQGREGQEEKQPEPSQEQGENQEQKKSGEEEQNKQKSQEEGKEQEQQNQKNDSGEEPQKEGEPQPKPQTPEPQGPQEERVSEQNGEEQQGQKPEQDAQGQPLQGQMTKENALRILDALKEGDKQLQDVRRPMNRSDNREVLKDW